MDSSSSLNAKVRIHTLYAQRHLPAPFYQSTSTGSAHAPQFTTQLLVPSVLCGGDVDRWVEGIGTRKKDSETMAAMAALELIQQHAPASTSSATRATTNAANAASARTTTTANSTSTAATTCMTTASSHTTTNATTASTRTTQQEGLPHVIAPLAPPPPPPSTPPPSHVVEAALARRQLRAEQARTLIRPRVGAVIELGMTLPQVLDVLVDATAWADEQDRIDPAASTSLAALFDAYKWAAVVGGGAVGGGDGGGDAVGEDDAASYEHVEQSGPPHDPLFVCTIRMPVRTVDSDGASASSSTGAVAPADARFVVSGSASQRKQARCRAAMAAYEAFRVLRVDASARTLRAIVNASVKGRSSSAVTTVVAPTRSGSSNSNSSSSSSSSWRRNVSPSASGSPVVTAVTSTAPI